ncbi:DNA methylase domain protein [Aciduliprofundum boonei T469]|nr:DNA methylase domain protein [Aciduliprofundum boonei T469]
MNDLLTQNLKKKESEMEENLKNLLRELFRSELEDLDFGIYRIMNFKRVEINRFIEEDLINSIEEEFKGLYEEDRKDLEKEVEKARKKIIETLGEDAFDENGNLNPIFENTKLGEEYKQKLEALKNVEKVVEDKIEIFSRIYEFFSRYYVDGDLIPIRRYTRTNDYIVPYNGEEVYLYWANKDQYYVKTTEYFQKYVFRAGSYDVTFRLREAHIDKNNVKGKDKFFILSPENFIEIKGNDVTIFFEYRELTKDEWDRLELGERPNKTTIKEALINDYLQRINNALGDHYDLKKQLNKKYIKSSGEETDKTVLEMHIRTYIAKNTKDYFIHKNLKKFFLTELDFYIKNEMLNMEDIERWDEKTLRKIMRRVRVFKNISMKIIEFLAEIEEFEKMLWEKKKFVLKTEYVITLDKIKEYAGEEFLESIAGEILSNEKQLREWKDLFDVNVKEKKDLIAKMNVEGDREWKKLPVDTKYFDEEFKWKLIMALTNEHDLDDILDGLLIKSENWQALNLMMEKYRERIKTIYIDPPYNTGGDEFLYKDNYQHSSWLTMMENRLFLTKMILNDKGTLLVSIDDNEYVNLYELSNRIFDFLGTFIVKVKIGGGNDNKYLVPEHEYVQFYAKNSNIIDYMWATPHEDYIKSFKHSDNKGLYYLDSLEKKGIDTNRPNLKYPIQAPDGKEIWPKTIWRLSKEEYERRLRNNEIVFKKDSATGEWKVYTKTYYKGIVRPRSLILKKGATREGNRDIEKLFGDRIYTYPKPVELLKYLVNIDDSIELSKNKVILDFFAGSGTTAHAVMMLNKEDGGKRKFILVEMADYFETVIIPRIKKVAYSFNWKDGKPRDMDGIGVFFKYNTLEQYEDTLNNIIFAKDKERQVKLKEFEDYIFHILDYGTRGSMSRLNIDQFKKPFSYKMEILEDGIPKTMYVDLVETFNYLLGLNVKKMYREEANGRNYVWVIGELRDKSKVLVVWRETEGIDMEKDMEYIRSKMRELAGTNPDYIYVNGDSHVPDAIPIETEFMKRMGA